MSLITSNVNTVVQMARLSVELGGYTPEDAVDRAARLVEVDAKKAANREGIFAGVMTYELLEEWRVLGSVARDIINGTVVRPSTGNVREYAINAVREAVKQS